MMPLVMKTLSVIFLIVFALSVVLLVLTFRKPRKVSVLSLILVIAISLVTLVVFSALINYHPSLTLLILMGAAGLVIGALWSQATQVYLQDGKVMSRNSVWYLLVWGGIFALTQLVSVATGRPPVVIMALLIMSTASVIGMNTMIIKRYLGVRAGRGRPAAGGRACPGCGTPAGPEDVFCGQCGASL
jgi:peptidoglycan/LPS O-acetylase OafA/YrhL